MWKSATTPIQYVAILSLVLFSSLVIFLTPISSSGVSVVGAAEYCYLTPENVEVCRATEAECNKFRSDQISGPGFPGTECSLGRVSSADKATVASLVAADANGAGILASAFNAVISGILTAIVTMVGSMMSLAGFGFDMAITYTILEFSTSFNGVEGVGGISDGIDTVWGGFRDIANIIMIAMYVFVAFSVMLNIETYGLKKLGVRILIVALLINFSLFLTKAVVDISNRTASQFNSAIKAPGGGPVSTADIFFRATGLSAFGYDELSKDGNIVSGAYGTIFGMDDYGKKFFYTFTLVLLYSVLTAVFIYGMLLLIIRMVMLIVLMFTSSLAFAAQLVPSIGAKWWGIWWGQLLKNALFAPLLMMMLWATVQIVGQFGGGTLGGVSVGDLAGGEFGTMKYMLQMMIVIGLLYASIKVASGFATFGGKFVQDMSMKGLSASLRAGTATTVGLAGRLGRNTLGRGARNISQRPGLRAAASSPSVLRRLGARATLAASGAVAGSSFDVRNTKAAKSVADKEGISLGAGEANYQAKIDRIDKRETAYVKDAIKAIGEEGGSSNSAPPTAPVRNEQGDQYVPTEDQQTDENAATIAREDGRIDDAREQAIDVMRRAQVGGVVPEDIAPERNIRVNNVPPTKEQSHVANYRATSKTSGGARLMDALTGRDSSRPERIGKKQAKELEKTEKEKAQDKRDKQLSNMDEYIRRSDNN